MNRAGRIGLGALLFALGIIALGVLTRIQYAAVPDRAELPLASRGPGPPGGGSPLPPRAVPSALPHRLPPRARPRGGGGGGRGGPPGGGRAGAGGGRRPASAARSSA